MSIPSGGKIAAHEALAALQTQGCDFLRVQGNLELQKFLDKTAKQQGVNVESVQFSDTVLKINKREKAQKRDLLVTTTHVYVFKDHVYKSCQRATPITQLRAILLAKGQPGEMLLQVRGSYDYRVLVVKHADIVRILCEHYTLLTSGNKLPVELVDDLSAVQVLKADVKGDGADEAAHPSAGGASGATVTPGGAAGRFSFGGGLAPGVVANAALDSQKPLIEGWLSKRGHQNAMWRRRYFRLIDANLMYYEARLKGTIELEHEGEVRVWLNKRLGAGAAGAAANNSSSSGSSNNGVNALAPLLYEYKIAGYNITPERHMYDILADEERLAAFTAFCETTKPLPPSNPTATATTRAGANESGNPKFFVAAEKFKALWPSASAANHSSHHTPTIPHAELLAEAKLLYVKFIGPDASLAINAPTPVREAVGDVLARQSLADGQQHKHHAAAASGSAAAGSSAPAAIPPAPSSAALTADLFNLCQHFAVEHMSSVVLPAYLEHSRESSAGIVRDFELKSALSDADKKRPACSNCLASFGLLKRRCFCRYCGEVLCSNCIANTCQLPPEYNIAEMIKVCDMCAGALEISAAHPHAFSYATKGRARPINLAASSPQELRDWLQAFRNSIQLQSAKGGSSSAHSAKAPQAAHQHKEGWLMKEDPTTKAWRRRYCILDVATGQLFYYELNLKGSLSLSEGASVHSTTAKATLSLEDSKFGGVSSHSAFASRFSISYHTRLYALAADSNESMESWIDAIQKVIRRTKPGQHSQGGGLSSLLQQREHLQLTPSNAAATGGTPVASPTHLTSGAVPADYSSSFAQQAPEGEVTFVFTDVQNSTKLWEHASEAMNVALERHDALLRMLLALFKGYEVKTEGDAFFVTFFTPLDAVRWCLAVQQALLENEWPAELLKQPSGRQETKDGAMVFNGLRIRMGIHVGHPACRRNPITGRMDYFGPVVNRSARVSDSAHGGQIVCTNEVKERIEAGVLSGEFPTAGSAPRLADCGLHRYKGISELVQVHQVFNQALQGRNPFPPLRTTKSDEEPPNVTGADGHTTTDAATATKDKGNATADAATTQMGTGRPTAIVPESVNPPSVPSASPSVVAPLLSVPAASSSVCGVLTLPLPSVASVDDDDEPPPPADEPPPPPPFAQHTTTTADGRTVWSHARPSHLSVPSISALSIHPYTPSAFVGRENRDGADASSAPSAGAPPSGHHHPHHSTDSDDDDAPPSAGQRHSMTRSDAADTPSSAATAVSPVAGASSEAILTPDASAGFMSPSAPEPSPATATAHRHS